LTDCGDQVTVETSLPIHRRTAVLRHEHSINWQYLAKTREKIVLQ
jgi:hypothetical protein